MTDESDTPQSTTNHRHVASYGAYDRFTVVGLATGITAADEQYFAAHPERSERWRPFIAGEVEVSDVTDVYIFEDLFFDGTRTGVRHRMLLHRVERPWDAGEPPAAVAAVTP